MVTFFEASVNLTNAFSPGYRERVYQALAAVRVACEADLLPAWLIRLVVKRVEFEILAGTWPMVSSESEG